MSGLSELAGSRSSGAGRATDADPPTTTSLYHHRPNLNPPHHYPHHSHHLPPPLPTHHSQSQNQHHHDQHSHHSHQPPPSPSPQPSSVLNFYVPSNSNSNDVSNTFHSEPGSSSAGPSSATASLRQLLGPSSAASPVYPSIYPSYTRPGLASVSDSANTSTPSPSAAQTRPPPSSLLHFLHAPQSSANSAPGYPQSHAQPGNAHPSTTPSFLLHHHHPNHHHQHQHHPSSSTTPSNPPTTAPSSTTPTPDHLLRPSPSPRLQHQPPPPSQTTSPRTALQPRLHSPFSPGLASPSLRNSPVQHHAQQHHQHQSQHPSSQPKPSAHLPSIPSHNLTNFNPAPQHLLSYQGRSDYPHPHHDPKRSSLAPLSCSSSLSYPTSHPLVDQTSSASPSQPRNVSSPFPLSTGLLNLPTSRHLHQISSSAHPPASDHAPAISHLNTISASSNLHSSALPALPAPSTQFATSTSSLVGPGRISPDPSLPGRPSSQSGPDLGAVYSNHTSARADTTCNVTRDPDPLSSDSPSSKPLSLIANNPNGSTKRRRPTKASPGSPDTHLDTPDTPATEKKSKKKTKTASAERAASVAAGQLSNLPADPRDLELKPYACAYRSCSERQPRVAFATCGELLAHWREVHESFRGTDPLERPFMCVMNGCMRDWKVRVRISIGD